MEVEKYEEMAKIQKLHWWFRGRRYLFSYLLRGLNLGDDISILEMGCGTGANLDMLKQFGTVYAAEMNDFSRSYTQKNSGIPVEYGKLPDSIPFGEKKFDLICIFDVLEHVEHDTDALQALVGRLNRHGRILLSVPATKWLYGEHDEMFHHFRRYSRKELQKKILRAGLQLETLSYFNTLLFPLAVLARLIDIFKFKNNSTGMETPPGIINNFLYRIFSFEKLFIKRSFVPFGLSLVAIATQKKI